MVGLSSARVWRRRKAKTISQSARWLTISAALHLPRTGGTIARSAPITSRYVAMAFGVAGRMVSGGWPARNFSYGLSWLMANASWFVTGGQWLGVSQDSAAAVTPFWLIIHFSTRFIYEGKKEH